MAIVTDGLVLYLHGACGKNNPATRVWKDLSGNGNDGELVNFGYTEDSGWVDGGLRFDGVDDYVRIPANIIDVDEDFTIEIVAIGDTGEYGSAPFSLLRSTKRRNTIWNEKGFGIASIYNPRTLAFIARDDVDYKRIGIVPGPSGQTVDFNGHICVKKEGNIIYTYYNYSYKNYEDISELSSFKTDNNIIISDGYDSHVKLLRIYNRALTDEEIIQNYQAGYEWTPQIGKREATTTMKPITTSLSRKGKGKRELISTMKPITTSLERKGKGTREVISTMKPITASLSRKGVGKREVTTTIKPITSSISKKLPPIHVDMDIRERTPNITTRERIPKLEVD